MNMKKIWMPGVVLLVMGTAVFAQENKRINWAGVGYQMSLMNVGEGAEWNMGHGLKILGRYSLLPINDNIGLGILFSVKLAFLKEADWISPDTGQVLKITDAKYILDVGGLVGVSLHGKITGPLGFGIGAGVAPNFAAAFIDEFWTLFYGKVSLEDNVFDLGPGLNAALMFGIGSFVIEAGADFSFSLYKNDSYAYTSERRLLGYDGLIKSNSVSSGASILRVSPYVLFGVKF